MCGITGSVWSDPRRAVAPEVVARMTEVLRHRGPDDAGLYRAEYRQRPPEGAVPGVALGFRRLAILDLPHGNQPLSNEDGSVWLVFNGEIYNYQALRHRLEGAGHRFRTAGDSETIVHLYEEEGLGCFAHLNGMFAIALWDDRQRQLVLARDRLGQKPLVYAQEPGRLSFASELKSLLEIPGMPRRIDPEAVDEYLTYQYVPHPRTIFRDIRKLPPGHLAVYRDERLEIRPYWQPDFQSESTISHGEAGEQLRALLASSVALRMQSDVPFGAFLSGGVDSSLIVALMQRASGERIRTFTISFSVAEYDEASYARCVADHVGTEHHEFQVTPDAVEILPRLVWHFDEPFADSSAIPTWYVSQLTREHVKVALTGDGGDELFAGYSRYRAVALARWLDRLGPLKRLLAAPFWQQLPSSARQRSVLRRLRRFSASLGMPPARRYLGWIAIFGETRRATLYQDAFLRQLPDVDPVWFLQQGLDRASRRDPVTAVSLADLVTYLPCDLMTKVDIASMAHGLECRSPFLDYRVVELAASLPLAWKRRGGRGKLLLQRTLGDLLPPAIWRRPKMGFGVPLEHWFRSELRGMTEELLGGREARCWEFFQPQAVRQLLDEHQARTFDHAYRLWALLVLELWLRTWTSA